MAISKASQRKISKAIQLASKRTKTAHSSSQDVKHKLKATFVRG